MLLVPWDIQSKVFLNQGSRIYIVCYFQTFGDERVTVIVRLNEIGVDICIFIFSSYNLP